MFMSPMKKILPVMALLLVLGSCGPYQKALKNDEIEPKYNLAVKYYEEGLKTGRSLKFRRSLRLLEQILPQYRGKPQGEKLAFMYADNFYHLEDYFDAGYQFERFTKSYGQSEKVGEAAFKSAKSYYYVSPRYSLDQTETRKALSKLQSYISKYPGGDHVGEANQIVAELRRKLEKKQFEIAKLYYHQEDYTAAIASMDNFIDDNPGSSYRQKAYFYKLDAAYQYAVKSFRNVMEGRLKDTKEYAEDYTKYFPEGEFSEKVSTISDDVKTRLKTFKE